MKFLKKFIANRVLSRTVVFLMDVLMVLLSVFLVYLFWNSFTIIYTPLNQIIAVTGLLVVMCIISFITFQTYSGIMRFSSFVDISRIVFALTLAYGLSYLLFMLAVMLDDTLTFRAHAFFIIYLVNMLLMIFSRVSVKEVYNILVRERGKYTNVFVYGTKQPAIRIAKSLSGSNDFNFKLKGFISDEEQMVDKHILGVPVYGTGQNLFRTLEQMDIKKIIVSPQKLDEIKGSPMLDEFLDVDIDLVTTLPLDEWTGLHPTQDQFKNIEIEDLLPRKQIEIDMRQIASSLEGARVMVTGAAGSIGSEIVRQVAQYNPYSIILIDQAETPLHRLRQEMTNKWSAMRGCAIVADIANKTRMEKVFADKKPHYIFHAAAYKHVPMMEDNVSEAIQTNIRGTKNLADLAVKYKAKKFVMISTDKAVNPTNVMGCSKRISEIYVQSLSQELKRKGEKCVQFITTRFGNVLGSNGSVIPFFEEQIKRGGPVTVTHPEIIRYFMTITEACRLVLQAGAMGEGGEIFVFDMGEPVKIVDLARRMIKLSGMKNKVKIEFTGLRHGEKLYEELLSDAEHTKPTTNDKIMIANVREYEYEKANRLIEQMIEVSFEYDDMVNVAAMKAMVPEFKSINSRFEELDEARVDD